MVKLLKMIVIVFCMNGLQCFAMQQEPTQSSQRNSTAERRELFEAKSVSENESETGSIVQAITRMHTNVMANLDQLQDRMATRVDQFESDVESGFSEQAQLNKQAASKSDVERLNKNIRRLELIAGTALVLSAIPVAIFVFNALIKH